MRTSVFALTAVMMAAAAGLSAEPMNNSVPAAKSYSQQIAAEAAEAKRFASEIATVAKDKKADLSQVAARIGEVEQRAAKIHELVAQLDATKGELNAAQQAEVGRLKDLAALLQVFLTNKKDMAAEGIDASERTALRNHALSVAVRADMIQKSAAKL
jgi:hypothetical protein